MASSLKSAVFLMESRLADAAPAAAESRLARATPGDAEALYDLGIAYSTGTEGVEIDLIEAHKWFNLAAMAGSCAAKDCRAEIADEMTAREIVEAQKGARAWLGLHTRRAA